MKTRHRFGLSPLTLVVALLGCEPPKSAERLDPCSRRAYRAVSVACAIAIREPKSDIEALRAYQLCSELIDTQQRLCKEAPSDSQAVQGR